ncbi:MAG: hypothetical protein ACJA1H_000633 [Glaciecola sp.]|jgi:hypothetical protein
MFDKMKKETLIIVCLLFLFFNCGSSNNNYSFNPGVNKTDEFLNEGFESFDSILFYMKGYKEFESFYESLANEITKRTNNPDFLSKFIIDTDINYPLGIESFEDIDTDFDKLNFDSNKFDSVCYILLGKERSFRENIRDQSERKFYFTVYVLLQELNTNKIIFKNKLYVMSKSNMLTQNSALGETIIKELQLK